LKVEFFLDFFAERLLIVMCSNHLFKTRPAPTLDQVAPGNTQVRF